MRPLSSIGGVPSTPPSLPLPLPTGTVLPNPSKNNPHSALFPVSPIYRQSFHLTHRFLAVQQPLPPSKRQWYDRLADAVLGEDDGGTQPHSRYALICQNCFA